jgi:glycosyltransferase involved in cell wall biosynthesis
MTRVAIVHDYLTQRGGAERVVLAMAAAFPDAPIYTSLHHPEGTFPEFAGLDVRPSILNRSARLRRDHRLALPLLAPTFSRMEVDADAVLVSSSGWAHGVPAANKIVYCYTPARWLYLSRQYATTALERSVLAALGPPLRRWDRRAAESATRYLANSTVVRDRIRATYGIDAEVLHSPHAADPSGRQLAVSGVEPGYFLVVSRLLGYKNVDVIVDAMRLLPTERLVVVGDGPRRRLLESTAPPNVHFTGVVGDDELRWLYASSLAVVTAAHEDLGLVPLEAAAFGKPAATLGAGGFLDTVVPDDTGVFFDEPTATVAAAALEEVAARSWDAELLRTHAKSFSEDVFIARLQAIVERALERPEA